MKELRLSLEDSEYKKAKKSKGKLTWKEFLMLSVGEKNDE